MKIFTLFTLFLLTAISPALAQGKKNPELFHTANVVFGSPDSAKDSLDWINARGEPDLAAHLIAAMRFSPLPRFMIDRSLETLTGEPSKTWFDWMLWQEKNPQIKPHDSIKAFKSTVFYSIDPAFKRFFRDDLDYDIRAEEIVWGGVRVDGIPALDNPSHIPAKQATYLKDEDEVFGVEINGDARAYPLRIMGWHEMFNDVIGGEPVSLAYCTLCGAGILFDGRVKGHKKPFTFGSSGFLYRSNKLMYDRNTDSLWNQFTGEPVSGPLRGSGIKLDLRPVVITTWGEWKKANPDTKVLSLDTGFRRDYGSGVVYKEYFASPELMFPALGDESRKLEQKDQVFGLRLPGGNKAWHIDSFTGADKVQNDSVAATDVVLIGDAQTRAVRAYNRKEYSFTQGLKDQNGTQWILTEDALISANGEELKRLPGHVSYWFAWAGYLGI